MYALLNSMFCCQNQNVDKAAEDNFAEVPQPQTMLSPSKNRSAANYQ